MNVSVPSESAAKTPVAPKTDGKVITFYSYKGGTGRTMLLANVAWLLASNGRRVLMIDWDLEAPGLRHYFAPYITADETKSRPGIIDLVVDYATALTHPEERSAVGEADVTSERSSKAAWSEAIPNLEEYIIPIAFPYLNQGRLDLIHAGVRDESYTTRVNTFNWTNFYDRLFGGAFFEELKKRLLQSYDFVLIDSRTGESDTAGVCTIQMPDTLVLCFTLNNQSIDGVARIAGNIRRRRAALELPLPMYVVPTRVDDTGEKDRRNARLDYAVDTLGGFLADVHASPEQYWGEAQVHYETFYAYEEQLAICSDRPGDVRSQLAAVERITGWLTGIRSAGVRLDVSQRQKLKADYENVHRPTHDLPTNRPAPRRRNPLLAWFERQFRNPPIAFGSASLILVLLCAVFFWKRLDFYRNQAEMARQGEAIAKEQALRSERDAEQKILALTSEYSTQSNVFTLQIEDVRVWLQRYYTNTLATNDAKATIEFARSKLFELPILQQSNAYLYADLTRQSNEVNVLRTNFSQATQSLSNQVADLTLLAESRRRILEAIRSLTIK